MVAKLIGPGSGVSKGLKYWELEVDSDGARTYTVVWQVKTDNPKDGPATVFVTPGLPTVGSFFQFGNDIDTWAYCLPDLRVTPRRNEENTLIWDVEQKFSTNFFRDANVPRRCIGTITDPLLEPMKISGSFVKYTKEIAQDRQGRPVKSSSHELFHGPQVQFDYNRPTVRIEQNWISLDLDVFSQMVDTVNDAPLWGLDKRKIKLSNISWERLPYNLCSFYFRRSFEFDIDFNTFDRKILDSGAMCLNGHWDSATGKWTLDNIGGSAPDPDNPQHYKRYHDRQQQLAIATLDGSGKPLDSSIVPTVPSPFEVIGSAPNHRVYRKVERYEESNFLLLGIPASLT